MMTYLRKYRNQIFLFTIVVFLFGMFVGFGSNFFTQKGDPNQPIVEVEGEKIPVRIYYSHLDRAMEQVPADKRTDEATRNQKRDEVLRDLIQGVIFKRLAQQYGVEVTDVQVINSLSQVPAFQTKGQFDPQLYARALQYQLKTTPQDFEEEQRQAIAFYKLRWLIQSSIHVTDKEAELAYAQAHNGQMTGYEKEKKAFHDQLWQEKVLWCFNQWFTQIGQKSRVKVHQEVLQAGARP